MLPQLEKGILSQLQFSYFTEGEKNQQNIRSQKMVVNVAFRKGNRCLGGQKPISWEEEEKHV